jgi:hypothetical protein
MCQACGYPDHFGVDPAHLKAFREDPVFHALVQATVNVAMDHSQRHEDLTKRFVTLLGNFQAGVLRENQELRKEVARLLGERPPSRVLVHCLYECEHGTGRLCNVKGCQADAAELKR